MPGQVDSRQERRGFLVTGATGFLGGAVARALLERQDEVRVLGRDIGKGLDLERLGADFRPVDLRDRAGTFSACRGVDAVVHAGAMTTDWGRKRDFFAINVQGTRNVVDACLQNGVRRLVYISSPSVMTREQDQFNLTESDPLPQPCISLYAETKKLGEEHVRAAGERGLETVILRPKGFYGPGDTVLFPRVIRMASIGLLSIIGDGRAVTSLTYIDDVVQAVLQALDIPNAAGKTYLITGAEELEIWTAFGQMLEKLGLPRPRRRIPVRLARVLAMGIETLWRLLPLPGEPPLQRGRVATLAFSQTYDISRARQELGYAPKVTFEEGLKRFCKAYKASTSGPLPSPRSRDGARPARDDQPPVRVKAELLNAGVSQQLERLLLPRGKLRFVKIPTLCAVLEHPSEGTILFDTGCSPRLVTEAPFFVQRFYRLFTHMTIRPEDAVCSQLRRQGLEPESVRWIVLSHFDPDHYGGLRDFPNARFICSGQAWATARQGRPGSRLSYQLFSRLLPCHLPDDFAGRLRLLPEPDGPAIGPFSASSDLFGDGSLRLVSLDGHAPGQLGAFVRLDTGKEWFLAADGCWSRRTLETGRGAFHRFMAYDRKAQVETYRLLRRLAEERPETVIIPTHCAKTADALLFDKAWR